MTCPTRDLTLQDSDSDMSDHSRSASPETATTGLGMARKRRSRFAPQNSQGGVEEDGGSREDAEEKEEEVKISRRMPSPEPAKSEEERMQEMVRMENANSVIDYRFKLIDPMLVRCHADLEMLQLQLFQC